MTPIRLTRPHTHAGTTYGAGERLEVDAATAEWLVNHDVATPESKLARTDPESKSLKELKP